MKQLGEKLKLIKVKSEKEAEAAEEEDDDDEAEASQLRNLLNLLGTVGILGLFFACGALLFTIWEDWWVAKIHKFVLCHKKYYFFQS